MFKEGDIIYVRKDFFVVTRVYSDFVHIISADGTTAICRLDELDKVKPSYHYDNWIEALSDQTFYYNHFTQYLRKRLYKYVNKLEVDVSTLPSYYYDPNPYGVEPQLVGTSGDYFWDDGEEWNLKIDTAIEEIEQEGVLSFLDLGQENSNKIDNQAIDYLNNIR